MKSAYATLGVPGNASEEDIRQAYERSTIYYSKEKLIENPLLVERLNEIKEAYKILSSPDFRQLHDRKLNATAPSPNARTVYVPVPEKSGGALKILLLAVTVMFAIGTYYSHTREEARKLKVAQEFALKKQTEEAEARAAQEQAAADAEKARVNALAENREQQLRAESAAIARQVLVNQTTSQIIQERQAQANRNIALQEERQRHSAAQQRAAADQSQLRNICMQNYGRPNC